MLLIIIPEPSHGDPLDELFLSQRKGNNVRQHNQDRTSHQKMPLRCAGSHNL